MSPRLRRDLLAWSLAASVSIICLAAYWLTHGSGPFWQDSGLFLAALKAGGGLLPPGYPIYLLLGRPFVFLFDTVLPGRSLAEAGNMFSAVWAALAAGLTSLSIFTLSRDGYRFFGETTPEAREPKWLGGWLGGLLAGLSYSLWFQALTAEAYALNAFFTSAVLCLVIHLGGEGPVRPALSTRQRRLALLLLVVHGLSFGNHPVTVVLVPAILWLAWTGRAALGKRRFLVVAVAAYLASALIPYLYLPYAARAFPATPYSGVGTITGLLAQASGSQWSGDAQNYGFTVSRFLELPTQLWEEFFAVGLLGLFFGARGLIASQPAFARLLTVALAPAVLLPLLYRRGGEYDFWLLTATMILFVVAGFGVDLLAASLPGARTSTRARRVWAFALVALALLPVLRVNPSLLDRTTDFVAEDFGRNLYRHLQPGAIFVALSDQENALTYYLDVVEHERPDVIRIDGGALSTPWFGSQLKQRYPDFEIDPVPTGLSVAEATDQWLAALMRASADGRHPLYVTTPPTTPAPPAGTEWLTSGGLWKLTTQGSGTVDVRDWDYTYRNAEPFDRPARNHAPELGPDGTIRREPYAAQIRRFHVQAWKNLGDWSLDRDEFAQAATAYKKALETDPALDNSGVFFGLGKSLFVLDRPLEARRYLERVGGRVESSIVAETSLYLGQICADQGEEKTASEYFDTVRRLAPEMASRLPPPGPSRPKP